MDIVVTNLIIGFLVGFIIGIMIPTIRKNKATMKDVDTIKQFISNFIQTFYLQKMSTKILMKQSTIFNDKEVLAFKIEIRNELIPLIKQEFKFKQTTFLVNLINRSIDAELYKVAVLHNIETTSKKKKENVTKILLDNRKE
jgi:uncharacterized membrane protein YraQ (UPF0718 family)